MQYVYKPDKSIIIQTSVFSQNSFKKYNLLMSDIVHYGPTLFTPSEEYQGYSNHVEKQYTHLQLQLHHCHLSATLIFPSIASKNTAAW